MSSLVYGAARAQDIVGSEVRFTYGWSCVISWIATIIAFLNAIMTLVLSCVYLDHLTERMLNMREELGMDRLSIRSETLRRINAMDDGDDTIDNIAPTITSSTPPSNLYSTPTTTPDAEEEDQAVSIATCSNCLVDVGESSDSETPDSSEEATNTTSDKTSELTADVEKED